MSAVSEREFEFSDKEFRLIQTLVSRHTGICLSDAKRNMVYSRLARRLRQLGLTSFKHYCELLDDDGNGDEIVQFTNAITTNLTSFFREPHHFEFLAEKLLPELMKRKATERRLRIWSAGCSTGEEPYTIAMVLKETVPARAGWDIKILATDLDSNVLDTARRGVYNSERLRDMKKSRLSRWFLKGRGDQSGFARARPELQELIAFRQLNLMHPWPVRGPFDFIFCRNVVIYFDKPTQRVLFNRYADVLADNGHIFLGHSETLFKVSDRFALLGNTIYQKIK